MFFKKFKGYNNRYLDNLESLTNINVMLNTSKNKAYLINISAFTLSGCRALTPPPPPLYKKKLKIGGWGVVSALQGKTTIYIYNISLSP